MRTWLYGELHSSIGNLNKFYGSRYVAMGYIEDFRARDEDGIGSDFPELGHDPTVEYDRRLAVQNALSRLTADEQRLALSVFMAGMTLEEYAEEVGLHRNTVQRQTEAVKEQLKNLLTEWYVF